MLGGIALANAVKKHRMKVILSTVALFAVFYMFCADEEFEGLGKLEKEMKQLRVNVGKLTTGEIDEDRKLFIENVFEKFYFSLIVTSTIGFGDIYPASVRTRLLCIIQSFVVLYVGLL